MTMSCSRRKLLATLSGRSFGPPPPFNRMSGVLVIEIVYSIIVTSRNQYEQITSIRGEMANHQQPMCPGDLVEGSPNDHDVILGRGKNANQRPGNIRFRQLTAARASLYKSRRGSEKNELAREVVEQIRAEGGRFLRAVTAGNSKGELVGAWEIVSDDVSLAKAKQAIRDAATERRRNKPTKHPPPDTARSSPRQSTPKQPSLSPSSSLQEYLSSTSSNPLPPGSTAASTTTEPRTSRNEEALRAPAFIGSFALGGGAHPAFYGLLNNHLQPPTSQILPQSYLQRLEELQSKDRQNLINLIRHQHAAGIPRDRVVLPGGTSYNSAALWTNPRVHPFAINPHMYQPDALTVASAGLDPAVANLLHQQTNPAMTLHQQDRFRRIQRLQEPERRPVPYPTSSDGSQLVVPDNSDERLPHTTTGRRSKRRPPRSDYLKKEEEEDEPLVDNTVLPPRTQRRRLPPKGSSATKSTAAPPATSLLHMLPPQESAQQSSLRSLLVPEATLPLMASSYDKQESKRGSYHHHHTSTLQGSKSDHDTPLTKAADGPTRRSTIAVAPGRPPADGSRTSAVAVAPGQPPLSSSGSSSFEQQPANEGKKPESDVSTSTSSSDD